MSQAFNCPSCGAMLETDGFSPSLRCQYCGQSVVVPAELRQPVPPPLQEANVVIEQPVETRQITPEDQARVQKTMLWVIVLIVIMVVVPTFFSIFIGIFGAAVGFLPLCFGGLFAGLGPLIAAIVTSLIGK